MVHRLEKGLSDELGKVPLHRKNRRVQRVHGNDELCRYLIANHTCNLQDQLLLRRKRVKLLRKLRGGRWTPCVPELRSAPARLSRTVGNATLRMRCSQQDRATKFGDARRLAEGSVDVYDWTSATFGSFLANDKDQRLYAARLELKRDLPALLADVPEHGSLWFSPCFGAPSAKGPISYFGSGAQQTPWHFDNQEGMVFVAAGSKTFELAPPSASAFLGPGPYPQNTLYATGAHAARVAEEVTVRAGEWLYLPACWWHRVTGGNGYNATLNLWFAMPEEKVDAKRRQAYERFQVGLLRAELLEVLGEESDQHTPALDDAQRAALTEREGVLAKRRQHFGSAPVDGMLERVRASAEHVVEGLY